MPAADDARGMRALGVLFAVNTLNFYDRQILGAVAEPIRLEWGLSDAAIGALTTAFTLVYAASGLPLGRLADRARRTRILGAVVFGWSLLTAASGLARSFWQLFALRLGVGLGEAGCAPAATSLIGDLFPPRRRARALSLFMFGLPVGTALSYAASALIAARWGWRAAFYVAGAPGLLCAAAALALGEPRREAADTAAGGTSWRAALSPTLWWIVASGVLHNFSMYALSAFFVPFLMRYHGARLQTAGIDSTAVFGLGGALGLLLGGVAADEARRRPRGRLLLAAAAATAAVPFSWMALQQPSGELRGLLAWTGLFCAAMYVYYASVYATIQDVAPPSLRATAMALYFLAMYVLGASFGPLATGLLSDHFTARAAAEAGATGLEAFRGEGLRRAMHVIPALGTLLAAVLFAGSRTVAADMQGRGQTALQPAVTRASARS